MFLRKVYAQSNLSKGGSSGGRKGTVKDKGASTGGKKTQAKANDKGNGKNTKPPRRGTVKAR